MGWALAAEPTNLVGAWRCTSQGGVYHDGFHPPDEAAYDLTITEQREPAFTGYYIWTRVLEQQVEEDDDSFPDYAIIK